MANPAVSAGKPFAPAVFGNSGRPINAIPGLGLGYDLAAAASAGKQRPNPAAKVTAPTAVPATAAGINAAAKTAELISMLTKHAQGNAPVPGPAGIPPAPQSAAVVQPAPPGAAPPPAAAPSPIPSNPRQQPAREKTEDDAKQQHILNSILEDGQKAKEQPDRPPTKELESDLMTHGKLAADSISAFAKFAKLYKRAKQDNSKPSRSAMGENNGLSYAQRKEDYSTGDAAWQSLDRYSHKKSSDAIFAAAFVDHCLSSGMSIDATAEAILKVGNDFDTNVQAELISGLTKTAVNYAPYAQAAYSGFRNAIGHAPMAQRAATGLAGATSGYYSVDSQDPNAGMQRAIEAGRGGLSGFLLPGQGRTNLKTPYSAKNIGQSAVNLGVKAPAGMEFGRALGGGSGQLLDQARLRHGGGQEMVMTGRDANGQPIYAKDDQGNYIKRNDNYYRNMFRAAGAIGGGFQGMGSAFGGSRAQSIKNPGNVLDTVRQSRAMLGGAIPLYGTMSAYQGDDPTRAVNEFGTYWTGRLAEKALPGSTEVVDPKSGLRRFNKQKFIGNIANEAEDYFKDYLKNKFSGIDDYVQQYTNPLFKAIGYDPANMDPWHRYAMLAGGLTTGVGGLMGNPYMMGAGGLMAGGGAMLADPRMRQQFGLTLPNASPYLQRATQPPPPPPAQ